MSTQFPKYSLMESQNLSHNITHYQQSNNAYVVNIISIFTCPTLQPPIPGKKNNFNAQQ